MSAARVDLFADATAQAAMVRRGEISPTELVEASIQRISAANARLNAIVIPLFDKARAEAAAPAAGRFTGVPYVLKDLSLVSRGDPHVAGISGVRAAGYRADHDSYFVESMRAAGFVLVGHGNSPELGIMGTTEPVTWGSTRNPWNLASSVGGGGGPAAAVAAGMVPVAHGNDGGGSVRMTAGLCGIVGLMPSRGRISSGPMIHNSDNVGGLLCEGVLTRSVRDAAAMLDIVSGHHPGDAYCAPTPDTPFAQQVGLDPGRLRVGVLNEDPTGQVPVHPECLRAVRIAADGLERLGHEVTGGYPDVLCKGSWPEAFNSCLAVVVKRELEHFGRLVGRPLTAADVEPATWGYAEMATHVTAVQYADGIESLRVQARETERWWQDGHDLLLTPMMPVPSIPMASSGSANDAEFLTLAVALTRFAMPFNVSGQPAISLPLHWTDDGMPVGVQLVAAYGREDLLLRVAAQLERALPWAHRKPAL